MRLAQVGTALTMRLALLLMNCSAVGCAALRCVHVHVPG
jgi:hypothetical protein